GGYHARFRTFFPAAGATPPDGVFPALYRPRGNYGDGSRYCTCREYGARNRRISGRASVQCNTYSRSRPGSTGADQTCVPAATADQIVVAIHTSRSAPPATPLHRGPKTRSYPRVYRRRSGFAAVARLLPREAATGLKPGYYWKNGCLTPRMPY